jgi:hypothetical protein
MLTVAAKTLVATAALSLLAQDAALTGDWAFTTRDTGPDGQPVCSETWTFGPDGAMTVEGGQEIVQKRYLFENDADGLWLLAESVSTNGLPDCMGNRADGVPSGERRTYLVPFNDGAIVVCDPPERVNGGGFYIGPTCYGWLNPAG